MTNKRQFIIAVIFLIGAAVLISSIGHGESIPIKKKLADFPMTIDSWRGKEQGLDSKVLEKLRLDDYLLRQYQSSGGKPFGLYIGYYQSQREGSTYHSPKNCLPGSGWAITKTEIIPIELSSGEQIRINQTLIQKGLNKQLVLYWYQDRGRIIASEYWAKIYLVWDAITRNRTDGTLVRINMTIKDDFEETNRHGISFIKHLIPLLSNHLPV